MSSSTKDKSSQLQGIPVDASSWVVEDDRDVAEIISLMMEDAGCQTTLLSTGADLIEALHSTEHHPDVICLDLSLPDFSGLELLRYIKQKEPLVPVIIITSNTSEEAIKEAVELGAYDYLAKDSDRTKFTTTFSRAIEYRQLKKQLVTARDALGASREATQKVESVKQEAEQSSILEEREREAIIESLRATSGHISKTAEVLGISRATLYRKMKKYQISTRGQF